MLDELGMNTEKKKVWKELKVGRNLVFLWFTWK